MEYVIRKATPNDAKRLIEYLNIVGGESDNLTFGAGEFPVSIEDERVFLENLIDNPRSVIFIAYKDGEVIGDAGITGKTRRMAHRAEFGITVRKDYWNMGIGSALIEKCVEFAKEHDIEILNLETRSDNKNAIHLYEKYGFKKTGTLPAFFKLNGEYIDFDMMQLDLRGIKNA